MYSTVLCRSYALGAAGAAGAATEAGVGPEGLTIPLTSEDILLVGTRCISSVLKSVNRPNPIVTKKRGVATKLQYLSILTVPQLLISFLWFVAR
jgi:hypothetical protein